MGYVYSYTLQLHCYTYVTRQTRDTHVLCTHTNSKEHAFKNECGTPYVSLSWSSVNILCILFSKSVLQLLGMKESHACCRYGCLLAKLSQTLRNIHLPRRDQIGQQHNSTKHLVRYSLLLTLPSKYLMPKCTTEVMYKRTMVSSFLVAAALFSPVLGSPRHVDQRLLAVSSDVFRDGTDSSNHVCEPPAEGVELNKFHYRGAALGGWLVLEPWITPSLFYQFLGASQKWGDAAPDHVGLDTLSFCSSIGPVEANKQLRRHWKTWVTEQQIIDLKALGADTVRIPVGDWMYVPVCFCH